MPLTKAIPEEEIDDGIVSLLQDIGYESRASITRDLTSREHSIAKVFHMMYRKNSSLEMLAWPSASVPRGIWDMPDDEFDTSPGDSPDDSPGDSQGDSSGEALEEENVDESSPTDDAQASFSLAEKATWAPGMNPRNRHRRRTFEGLSLSLETIMGIVQKVLGENGYDFIHPNQVQLWARSADTGEYLCFDAEYERANEIALVASVPCDGKEDTPLLTAIGVALGEPLTRSESSSTDSELEGQGVSDLP
jgi:hypothetical protein